MAELISTLAELPLDAGCTITAEAIDPNTGAVVGGVMVSAFAIYAYQPSDADHAEFERATPLWLPLPTEPPSGVAA